MGKRNYCKGCGKPKFNNFDLCADCYRSGSLASPREGGDDRTDSIQSKHGTMFSLAFGRLVTEEDLRELHRMKLQKLLRGETEAELIAENDRRLQAITAGVPVPEDVDGDKGANDEAYHLARSMEMAAVHAENPRAKEIIKANACNSELLAVKRWSATL